MESILVNLWISEEENLNRIEVGLRIMERKNKVLQLLVLCELPKTFVAIGESPLFDLSFLCEIGTGVAVPMVSKPVASLARLSAYSLPVTPPCPRTLESNCGCVADLVWIFYCLDDQGVFGIVIG